VYVALCAVFRLIVVLFCVMCVICVLCVSPGENPFAVKLNNNNKNLLSTLKEITVFFMYKFRLFSQTLESRYLKNNDLNMSIIFP
jgi:hypothetical protein